MSATHVSTRPADKSRDMAEPAASSPIPQDRRTSPLALRAAGADFVVMANEVNVLLEATDVMSHALEEDIARHPESASVSRPVLESYKALRLALLTGSPSFADPPLVLDDETSRRLRSVLVDVGGYQRGELASALRQLRDALVSGV